MTNATFAMRLSGSLGRRLSTQDTLGEAVARVRAETRQENQPGGVLVTWYGPGAYTVEGSSLIPPGLVYECLAEEGSPSPTSLC
jgi:surface antigen